MAPARSKYGNKPTIVDGVRYASKAEAKRGAELRLLEKAGEIHDLKLQPRFPLRVGDVLICTFVGDFQYIRKYAVVVEDVKGVETPAFKIKRKLMKAIYDIDVVLIKKSTRTAPVEDSPV